MHDSDDGMKITRFGVFTRLVYVLILFAGIALHSSPALAVIWIEQAEADLTCTGLASPAERAQLDADAAPASEGAQASKKYFAAAPRNKRHARYRHLVVLAAIEWWADTINDQTLRANAGIAAGLLAGRYLGEHEDVLFRQISLCSPVHLISVAQAYDKVEYIDKLAVRLAADFGQQLPEKSVQDWPLILALQQTRHSPAAREGITRLVALATTLASEAVKSQQAERGSRLLAAAAQGMLVLGNYEKAKQLAVQSGVVTGKRAAPQVIWRSFPTLYDAFADTEGPEVAAKLTALIPDTTPPASLVDNMAAFETLLRLSNTAMLNKQYQQVGPLHIAAFRKLVDMSRLQRSSMSDYRAGIAELEATRDASIGQLAHHDKDFANRTLKTYILQYEKQLAQAQSHFVADAREQLVFNYKVDNTLGVLSQLYPHMPAARESIEDTLFRLAQLRSFGRLTLASVFAGLDEARIDPKHRFHVERFFTLSTQTAVWLRRMFARVNSSDGALAPSAEMLWNTFAMLDVFYEETAKQLDRYVAFVRKQAPGVAELATPRPLPLQRFQELLQDDEAIVATLATPQELYVWAISRTAVSFANVPVMEQALIDKVRQLRASLMPGNSSGTTRVPAYNAALAHELYGLIFKPVAATLKSVEHVIWFGHGPLGSLPPAVLVDKPPPRALVQSPKELAATSFLVDRYAFSVLADLSLFPVHRNKPLQMAHRKSFLGVGAPMLAPEELGATPRARSYELAGGMDGTALENLPKLAASVDELRALANIMGEDRATLWLGAEASEQKFVDTGLKGYQVIALATHGFLPYEIKQVPEPALLLALDSGRKDRFDGILTSKEIASLDLDADMVILSACNTAGSDGRPRAETFTGLSQAFFTAGAGSLMSSHWPVMSGAATRLSVETVDRSRNQGESLAVSLQQAMQLVRKEGAASALEAHPSYWGPFVIVGDGMQSLAR